jgi:hypothetical protein
VKQGVHNSRAEDFQGVISEHNYTLKQRNSKHWRRLNDFDETNRSHELFTHVHVSAVRKEKACALDSHTSEADGIPQLKKFSTTAPRLSELSAFKETLSHSVQLRAIISLNRRYQHSMASTHRSPSN